ncbi:dephospho-CoA kinase [Francisellaceae bacterium]|nr:dephospho-CoA kinase [Francisellaceae bacterium]
MHQNSPKQIVALTGGIASGKSTVRKQFESLGIQTVCADEIARQVVEKNSPALKKISHYFGKEILNLDQTLNRKALGKIIFEHSNKKKWLENLLHPIIRNEIKKQSEAATSPYAIIDIPLLTQENIKDYDYAKSVIVVAIDPSVQLARLCQRENLSEEAAQKIIKNQISQEERLKLADHVIQNNDNTDKLIEQVNLLHQKFISQI